MHDWKLPWQGGCRCGRLRLEVSAPPLLGAACHCTGCQRMSSSAFSLTLSVPAAGFRVTSGEPVVGGLHGATRHFFCGRCLSWVFTRPEGLDDIVNLRATMLDAPGWFVPFAEFWTSERLPWARTPATHSFPTMPEFEAFPALVAEFAAHGARPRLSRRPVKEFLDTDHPMLRPLWVRVLLVALAGGWGLLEFASGNPFWGVIFLGLAGYAAWGFFLAPRRDGE